MNEEKLFDLKGKILEDIERFNVTLKYGSGEQITLPSRSKVLLSDDGWLIVDFLERDKVHYINLESVYEAIIG